MRILHIIPYKELVPAKNGGALRCFHLAHEMSKFSALTILTYQPQAEFKNTELSDIEIANPISKTIASLFIKKLHNALAFRYWMRSTKGPADIVVIDFAPALIKLLKSKHYDVVVFEHLNSMLLGKICKRYSPNTIRIADQHNVDHLLFKQEKDIFNKKEKKTYLRLKQLESTIYKYCHSFFACSENDKTLLEELNNKRIKGNVIPNGTKRIKTINLSHQKNNTQSLIFCGSLDYIPNKNGLLWFYLKIWPLLVKTTPNINLTIIGRNGHHPDYEPLKNTPGINFIGEVADVTPYYHQCHIAIVPLLEGSGTRLKILEAMQMGNPVVSTSIGAEGLNVSHLQNILIADSENDFAKAIEKLLTDKECSKTISVNAKQMIDQHFVWDKIGEMLKDTFIIQINAK